MIASMAEKRGNCSHMNGCELFPLFQIRSALRVWQINYCEGTYERCARYQAACRGEAVPINLLPNGKRLIAAGAK
jgi:hypothetical protein